MGDARARTHAASAEAGAPGWARAVTELLAPAPMVAVLLLAVAWASTDSLAQAILWGATTALFASGIPFAFILLAVRRRRLTDHHVRLRAQRPLPLLFGLASVVVGLALIRSLGAPQELVALVGAMVVGLLVALLITLRWKISIHTAVTSGSVATLVLVFGPTLVLLAPVVALVGCARVAVRDHTPAQVVAGAAVGTVVAAMVFSALR